jgi:hypothetical protein
MSLCARMLARLSRQRWADVVASECRVGRNRSRPTMTCRHDRPTPNSLNEQLCRERMPKCVWTHTFGDAGVSCRVCHRLLDNGFMEVKARRWSPSRIGADASGRKRELPTPLRGRIQVLAVEREG